MQADTYRMLFIWVAFAAIFYFILWRPQAQQRKQHQSLIMQLKRGDEIVTAGGLVGLVVHIQEQTAGKAGVADRITIKSGESRVVVERGRIASVITTTGAASATPSA